MRAVLGTDPAAGGWRPGGGVNPHLIAGRMAGLVEKRHLVLKRRFAARAAAQDRPFIDLGTDYCYPFFEEFGPTQAAMTALAEAAAGARHYPSSYGTESLRTAFADFLRRWFGVAADSGTQLMVSTGASQVFDALTRTYAGRTVIVPDLTLSTVTSVAAGNGARIVRVALDEEFRPDLAALDAALHAARPDGVRMVYLNSPQNPSGAVLGLDHLARIVALAREHQVLLVHDHDSWCTTHSGERAPNILQGRLSQVLDAVSAVEDGGWPGCRRPSRRWWPRLPAPMPLTPPGAGPSRPPRTPTGRGPGGR